MSAQNAADPAAHSPRLQPLAAGDPASVGPYSPAGRLAEDAAGVVYGAADDQGAPVAVRVADEPDGDAGDRSALARRVAALRGLAGVCVLPVLAAGTDDERPWLATVFPSGETLRTRVEVRGPVSNEALIALAAGTAEALTAAELAGVAYAAITPDDVVLTPDGPRVHGLDAVGGAGGSGLAAVGPPAESAEWAGPEIAGGAEPSAPAGVYSWGCLVAYAATGRHPFRTVGAGAEEPPDVHRRPREEGPDLSGVPTELAPLIELALSADPDARPSAESAYRGLVAYASTDDTSQIATPGLSDRLRAILADGWSGVGAEQQGAVPWTAPEPADPAERPAPEPSEPTAPEDEAETAAEATTAAPAEEAGLGTADSGGRGAADRPDGAAAGGATAADAPSAAERSGILPTAIVTASSMIAAIVIGTSGFLVAASLAGDPDARPDPSPSPSSPFGTAQETVADATESLRSGENYRAVHGVRDAGAAQHREYVLATPDGAPLFQSLTLLGDPESPAAGSTARIHRPESDRLVSRNFGGGEQGRYTAVQAPTEAGTAWGDSRAPVLRPFESLEDTMAVNERIEGELNGTTALHVSGTFTVSADGAEHTGAPFDLWAGPQGQPLRLTYTAGGAEHEWGFTGFGGLDSRICGAVEGVPGAQRAYPVPTSGGTDCGDVRPVVEDFLATVQQQAAGSAAEVGEWTCRLEPATGGADAGACYRGGIGAADRVDLVVLD